MRDSIIYSSLRALFVAFFTIIGFCLGILAIVLLIGSVSSGKRSNGLTTVHTEEILPNAEGKRDTFMTKVPVILQINIDGIVGMGKLTTKDMRQLLVESREGDYEEDRVKAILLNINTPGGTVSDANGIYLELMDYKKKYNIPIYAYVDGLCASGGMYIALAADKIISSDVSLIGSVGVIAPTFMNVTPLLEKIGVDALTISAGKGKDSLNPFRKWQPGEDKNYKQIIDYYYQHFVNLVVKARPELSKDKLTQEYGAHIFPADIAQQFGFIDESNKQISDAINDLVSAAGLEKDNYQVIQLESKDWWDSLFSAEAPWRTGTIKHKISFSQEMELLFQNKFLYMHYPL